MRGLSALATIVIAIVLTVPVAGAAHGRQRVPAAAPKRPQLLAQTPAGSLTVPDSIPVSGSPSTVAADSNGTVYVGLGQNGVGLGSDVAEFDSRGNFVRAFGAHLAGQNPLVAVGPDHNVYVWAASTFGPIQEYAPSGALVRTIALPSSIVRLTDIELDGAGNIFATGYDNNGSTWKVLRFDPAGNETAAFPVGRSGDPLSGLAVDADGTLWVVRQSGDVSVLLHVEASGRDLKNAPFLGTLGGGARVTDIDYADGRLYSIGLSDPFLGPPDTRGKIVLSTFTPGGFVVSRVVGAELSDYCCHGGPYSVAIVGNRVYATGLDTSKLTSGVAVSDLRPQVGVLGSSPVFPPAPNSYVAGECGGRPFWPIDAAGTLAITNAGHTGCDISFVNHGNPCSAGNKAEPHALFQNGNIISRPPPAGVVQYPLLEETYFNVGSFLYGSGPVYAEWICTNPTTHTSQTVFEYKGDIELYDPSGVVVDAKTGRGIAGATVVLQVSPGGSAGFSTPSLGDVRPQVNPEVAGSNGSFGWDVAPGRWRVKVTAFGYKPLVSSAYNVPPPVSGLKLQLNRIPRSSGT